MFFRSKTEEGLRIELPNALTEGERNWYGKSLRRKSSNGKTDTKLYASLTNNKLKSFDALRSRPRSY